VGETVANESSNPLLLVLLDRVELIGLGDLVETGAVSGLCSRMHEGRDKSIGKFSFFSQYSQGGARRRVHWQK
jgi:hypothetical protein